MSAWEPLARPDGKRVQCEDATSGTPPSGRAGQLSFDDELALRAEADLSWDEWVRALPVPGGSL